MPTAHSPEEAANSDNSLNAHFVGNHDEIAKLAYQYWLERGGAHGSHQEDWHRAERELIRRREQAAEPSPGT